MWRKCTSVGVLGKGVVISLSCKCYYVHMYWFIKDLCMQQHKFLSYESINKANTFVKTKTVYVGGKSHSKTLRVSDQNGISLLYILIEIHHSGREPLTYS